MRAYLFDLDGTLVDTSAIELLRRARDWKGCVAKLGSTKVFAGVPEMMARLQCGGASIVVVTTSVSFYAERALAHHALPYDYLVAYHDVTRRKPFPDAYQLALRKVGLSAEAALGVGDDEVDAQALHSAGIFSVGAAWNPAYHSHAKWDAAASAPDEVISLVQNDR